MFKHRGKTIVLCLLAIGVFVEVRVLAQATVAASGGSSDSPGAPAVLQGPSFVPDARFQGSTLTGWHPIGQAEWRAENGELIGKGIAGSGWLMLDPDHPTDASGTPKKTPSRGTIWEIHPVMKIEATP